jgi:hypothetical protein
MYAHTLGLPGQFQTEISARKELLMMQLFEKQHWYSHSKLMLILIHVQSIAIFPQWWSLLKRMIATTPTFDVQHQQSDSAR